MRLYCIWDKHLVRDGRDNGDWGRNEDAEREIGAARLRRLAHGRGDELESAENGSDHVFAEIDQHRRQRPEI